VNDPAPGAAALARLLKAGEVSPTEAVRHYLDRIDRLDGTVNGYITVMAEEALAEAAARERDRVRGPLWGVPVGVKDVIDAAGQVTTCHSWVMEGAAPAARDSTVVARLRAAGAIVLGKVNTHEFAYGAFTTSPRFGPARNPWNLEHIVGGSSGGSGAVAAADLAAGTLGTDTAGSIRIPACFNGVTGTRPTTGRVSNRGVFPVSFAFDTVGPIARSAEDCAVLLGAIAGHDAEDASTADVPVPDYPSELAGGIRGLRIGVVRSLLESELIDARIAAAVERAIGELRAAGATISDVDIPLLEHFGAIQQTMQFADAADVHREWLRTRLERYGADVRARLLTGLFVPSHVYALGQRARRVAYGALRGVFREVDLLVAPTLPTLPPRIGEDTVEVNGARVLYRLTIIPYNSVWSLPGVPVTSVPVGLVDGLPAGMAIVGWRFGEAATLRAAHTYQQVTDWHERRPPVEAAVAAT
jgi:aspartyl-tRNA(Asn)/glutamyl-tRNA(Gln) amidotransferase subunit A